MKRKITVNSFRSTKSNSDENMISNPNGVSNGPIVGCQWPDRKKANSQGAKNMLGKRKKLLVVALGERSFSRS